MSRREQSRKKAQLIKICVLVLVLGVGGYFGFGYVRDWQNKVNEKSAQAAQDSDGGQVGHIADLYSVLDATDTDRRGGIDPSLGRDARRAIMEAEEEGPTRRRGRNVTGAAPGMKDMPVIPAVYTLDLEAAKIPEGRANGIIAGTNFVADAARLDRVGQNYALTLRQGTGASGDREILIYLGINITENFPGYKWSVTKDMKGPKVPQVVKRWKTNPKFAPLQKSFSSGYAMNLELGAIDDETISGKIFISLPDAEQTVVAGLFSVQFVAPIIILPGMSADDLE
jgi:hypothetical protein